MPAYKNLILIGTSHISKQSVNEIKKTIVKEKPDIIALELDFLRFKSLTGKRKKRLKIKNIKQIGLVGFFFNIIGAWTEKKMGKLVGMTPGSEMLTAIRLAKKEKINIVLIDRDIRITLKRISDKLTIREKKNFVVDFISAILFKKKLDKLDLTKVPNKETIRSLTLEFKKRYPNLHKILVIERNIIMAKNLYNLMNKNPKKKIVAIVGAGHKEEMIKILKNEI